ncbi:hypothetical protein IAR55_002489 [Kwoniella newhampshirensis]|uniref:Uncharacterized protein n=1 Tax=Kwoniella newhampshirensis TaxID=1651941 RepID=A0AAW0Z1L6_9TREE
MARTIPARQHPRKRPRSPSPPPSSSSSSLSSASSETETKRMAPPAKPKKPRNSKLTPKSSKSAKRSSESRKSVTEEDTNGSDSSSSSNSKSNGDQEEDSGHPKRSSAKKGSVHQDPKKLLLEHLSSVDERAVLRLLAVMRNYNGQEAAPDDEEESFQKQTEDEEAGEGESDRAEAEEEEEELLNEGQREELYEQAWVECGLCDFHALRLLKQFFRDIMAMMLETPFANRRSAFAAHYTADLESITASLDIAMLPFKNDTLREQADICRRSNQQAGANAAAGWKEASEKLMERRDQMMAIYEKIAVVHKEKQRLVIQAKTAWQKALARHEADFAKLEEEALRRKEKYHAKFVKATDPARIQKEVNMSFQKVLSRQNS